ncbi:MAG: DNA repair protein RadA [Nitrospinae bacterium]|nr:DNA repair protein RadA [Nitrospinota bacterium]
MAKKNSVYVCQSCGVQSPKWQGKCADCGAWNSFLEEEVVKTGKGNPIISGTGLKPLPISEIEIQKLVREQCGIAEYDRVLGGGMVPGSLILIGGDPGIGKSTLMLQTSGKYAEKGHKVLYVSGEESASQIKLRAQRLGVHSDNLYIYSETALETICSEIKKLNPFFVVIDSIQTIFSSSVQSIPGSLTQVRESASAFMRLSKNLNISIVLIGHVTKEGAIAGPKVLEHTVDTVLYFEGERGNSYRIVRAIKNRFGPTNELGIFEMLNEGISEVSNPSELFLSDIREQVSGYAVTVTMEGTRPFLIEIQSLITSSSGFGSPRRMANGVDSNRLSIIIAILEKRAGLHINTEDIFVNVVGGVKLNETAVDLAIVAAMVSSFQNKPINDTTIFIGEVGLAGETRQVSQLETRLKEAVKLGFKRAVIPKSSSKIKKSIKNLEIIEVKNIRELMDEVF